MHIILSLQYLSLTQDYILAFSREENSEQTTKILLRIIFQNIIKINSIIIIINSLLKGLQNFKT